LHVGVGSKDAHTADPVAIAGEVRLLVDNCQVVQRNDLVRERCGNSAVVRSTNEAISILRTVIS